MKTLYMICGVIYFSRVSESILSNPGIQRIALRAAMIHICLKGLEIILPVRRCQQDFVTTLVN